MKTSKKKIGFVLTAVLGVGAAVAYHLWTHRRFCGDSFDMADVECVKAQIEKNRRPKETIDYPLTTGDPVPKRN